MNTSNISRLTSHGKGKAMILAAGMGTRLKPLTDDKPKCLMPLAGRPLIDWTLSWLKEHGITECVINLHYLPDMVKAFVGDGSQYGMKVRYSYEQELLGTAGAVKKVEDFFTDGPFYVIYADNFSQWDLEKLRDVHEGQGERIKDKGARSKEEDSEALDVRGEGQKDSKTKNMESEEQKAKMLRLTSNVSHLTPSPRNDAFVVMAVHWREDVTQSGMIEMDEDDRIVRIVEKPKPEDVTSHFVNAGFLYMDPKVLQYIPEGVPWDFSYQVFPGMLEAGKRLYAVKMDEPIIGIDTIEAYEQAERYAQELKRVRSEEKEVRR
jgi:NDP-sugar pyrophosphorylase family protein